MKIDDKLYRMQFIFRLVTKSLDNNKLNVINKRGKSEEKIVGVQWRPLYQHSDIGDCVYATARIVS